MIIAYHYQRAAYDALDAKTKAFVEEKYTYNALHYSQAYIYINPNNHDIMLVNKTNKCIYNTCD